MPLQRDDRSIGDLFTELTTETRTLVLQELKLAKAEINEKIQKIEHGALSMTIGGAVLYTGVLALVGALIIGLAQVMELWLAALLVGLLMAGLGYMLIARGKENIKGENLTLNHTRQTLKEDKQWAKAQIQ